VFTPGDSVDVLVAMNPAALKTNVRDLKQSGILIVNSDAFTDNDLRKAQVTSNPLEDHSLDGYRLFAVGLERMTRAALQELGLDAKTMDRCKNFFALGMCYWLYNRTMDLTYKWIEDKFKTIIAKRPKRSRSAMKSRPPSSHRVYTATSAEIRPWQWDLSPRRRRQAFRYFSARTRSPRLPISFTSFPCTKISA
jgi:hypothetical protein